MRVAFVIALSFALLLSGCAQKGDGTEAPPKITILTSRDNSIPANATKVMVSADEYPPKMHSSDWEEPVPLGTGVNTAGAEDSPFVTPDGNTLYFFFTPDPSVPVQKQVLDGVTGVWVSEKRGGQWTKAERVVLQDQGKLAMDGCQFVQDSKIWFCSAREGYTGVHWFIARYENGIWQKWERLAGMYDYYEVGELHFSKDGSMLYFHSGRAGGKGKYDIWASEVVNGTLQPPKNVAALNTAENEGWPFLSQDGTELWFTRTYMGSPAIYMSKKTNGTWSAPELIVSQFAGEPTLDEKGNLYFVHHYYSNGTMLEADIYFAKKK